MVNPVGTVVNNVKDRVSATVELFKDQVTLLRDAVREVRERVGIPGKEPTLPRRAGLPGTRSSLQEIPIAVGVLTADNITKWALKQAEITRRWFGRA
jgi:hypothetical protein